MPRKEPLYPHVPKSRTKRSSSLVKEPLSPRLKELEREALELQQKKDELEEAEAKLREATKKVAEEKVAGKTPEEIKIERAIKKILGLIY